MSDPPPAPAPPAGMLARIEDGLLAGLLGMLIVLASTQILLRNVFDTGIAWIGPLLRYGVLWLGLLGALCATRTREHISIDALERFLAPRGRALCGALSSGFTSGVCTLIAYHGGRLVWMDREAGSLAFAAVPAWCTELIIPLCFGGMAVRFALRVPSALRQALRDEAPAP